MNNITPEVVKNLLDSLITSNFDDILDYRIITRQNDEGRIGVGIDVILKHKLNITSDIEYNIERRIRNVMRYISPDFVIIDFYYTDDY